jgi:hypothetical protein
VPSSILGSLHPGCQQQLLQLLVPWREAAAALAAALQEGSSSDSLLGALLQDCRMLLEHVAKQKEQQQQEEEEEQGQHAGDSGACNSAAAAAAVSGVAAAPLGPDQACCSNSSSGADGSCVEFHEAAAALAAAADTLCQRMSMLASCLVLQFIEESCTSGAAEASAAWQQTVPLQVLLLCSQLQQLHGAMQRCVAELQESSQTQQQQQQQQEECEEQQAASLQQEPEQLQQGDAAQATAAPEQHLTALVEHVVALLQSIRRFKDVNETMSRTAVDSNCCTTPAGCAPDAASSRTQTSSSSRNSSSGNQTELDPVTFFCAGGRLASGVWGLKQPIGAGVWAPVDAASADLGPQQQQQQLQHQPVASARHAAPFSVGQPSSSSSAAAPLAVPQQAWQVLLGCCAWQQALQHVDEGLAANLQPPTELLGHVQRSLFRFIGEVDSADKAAAQAYVQQVQALGIHDLNMCEALHVCAVPHALERLVRAVRGDMLERLGFSEDMWKRRLVAQAKHKLRRMDMGRRLARAGYGTQRRDGTLVFNRAEVELARLEGVLSLDEDPGALYKLHMWDEEDEIDIMQREVDDETELAKEAQRRVEGIDAKLRELEELAKEMFDDGDSLAGAAGSGASSSNNHGSGQAAGSWGSGTSSSGSASPRAVPSASNGFDSSAANGAAAATHSMPAAAAAVAAAGAGAATHDGPWVLPEEVNKAKQALRWVFVECTEWHGHAQKIVRCCMLCGRSTCLGVLVHCSFFCRVS